MSECVRCNGEGYFTRHGSDNVILCSCTYQVDGDGKWKPITPRKSEMFNKQPVPILTAGLAEYELERCCSDSYAGLEAIANGTAVVIDANELAELRRDAERYRFLRSDDVEEYDGMPTVFRTNQCGNALFERELDEAVDAAIAQEKAG